MSALQDLDLLAAAAPEVLFVADDELPPEQAWAIVCRPLGYLLAFKQSRLTPRNLAAAIEALAERRASQLVSARP